MSDTTNWNNHAYYILPIEMAQHLNYDVLYEENIGEVRTNVAGTLCVVEYKGPAPEGTWLSHEEVSAILEGEDWQHPDETINT